MRLIWSAVRRAVVRRFEPDPIDEELEDHFEHLHQERLACGDTPDEAARFARHRLGHRPAIREEVRDLRLAHRLEAAGRSVRLALRTFRRHSAYGLATMILGLGIGLSLALFSVADAVIFAPLPYPAQDRVHLIWKTDPSSQAHLVGELAYPELADLQGNMPEAQSVAVFPAAPYGNGRTLETSAGVAVQIESCPASPDFFRVMGVQPALGRGLAAGGAEPVVVLSDWVWRRHFGGRPGVIGQSAPLNGRAHTILGVMPPEFDFPRGAGLWVNLPSHTRRGSISLQAAVRVREGVSREQVQSAADRAFQLQVADHPKQYSPAQRAVVTPLADFFAGTSKRQLLLSLAAALLLLLSSSVSAGNLFLSRALNRRSEILTRAALGATRWQLAAPFLAEACAAAALAVAGGVALAVLLIRALTAWAPADIPRIENAGLHANALVVAAAVAVLATLACAVGPLLLLRGGGRRETLLPGPGTRTAGSRAGTRLQGGFVLLQAALTVTILIASAMLFASYRALLRTDSGFGHRDALTVNFALRGPQTGPETYRRVYAELIDYLRADAAVTHAAGVLLRPLEGPIGWDVGYTYEFENGQRDPDRVLPKANFEVVTPGYFEAIGTPLRKGRDFDRHDTRDTERVLIVSQSVADHFQRAGLEPIGQRMGVFGELRKVVGVAADARFRGVREAAQDVYVPNGQIDIPTNYLIVRGNVPAAELLALVRRGVRAVAPDQALAGEATLGELLDRNTARDRFNLALLLLFAAGAIVLAAAGIHSVAQESIAVRSKELAIRVALGAGRPRLAAEATWTVVAWVCAGAFAGSAVSWSLGPAAEELLYGVSPRDLLILSGVAAFVMAVALVSSFAPAWKAAGRDPRRQLFSD